MQIGINDIIKILPHSYPFLLVDKVLDCDYGRRIRAIKNVTFNEPFFIGHFPNHPIMPGVLIIESLAQAAALCMSGNVDKNVIPYLVSIESAKFRKPVVPGDTLLLQVNIQKARLKTCKFECIAYVNEEKVAEATILAMLQTF
ncbi:3-hydroxyacyl-[acyl-carrier-protein] dehydratase FabZ [Wolbachia pipientis]|uniref:3-hydroxyacyl-[acyl-carrier-protein] dehydratase FabZ n=1 Tax=Wolbachia pipientis TaxID=955 RepID=A0A1E7QJY3_WOLPI|nr:3-hydroxyacyl-ACP dehydratase FabZ [Wolbachia pipientis]OEY86781.1 3-hydroxyacyl-[acyl-carrier-protein] dehydratase FabZ [Wolbachia pipientis]